MNNFLSKTFLPSKVKKVEVGFKYLNMQFISSFVVSLKKATCSKIGWSGSIYLHLYKKVWKTDNFKNSVVPFKGFGEMFVYVTFYYKKHELGKHWWQITDDQISAGNMLMLTTTTKGSCLVQGYKRETN